MTLFWFPNFQSYSKIQLLTVTQYKPFTYSDTFWPFPRVPLLQTSAVLLNLFTMSIFSFQESILPPSIRTVRLQFWPHRRRHQLWCHTTILPNYSHWHYRHCSPQRWLFNHPSKEGGETSTFHQKLTIGENLNNILENIICKKGKKIQLRYVWGCVKRSSILRPNMS